MQGNRTGGIDLTPDTTWPPNSPTPVGDPNNPNHDIDPPYNIHVDQAGNLTGRVRVTPTNPAAAACVGCTVQVFSANPTTLDRQGRDKINMAVAVGGDGSFSTNIGSVPAQLALTATDQGGNTSEFAVLTRTLGLEIGPPLVGSAIPGQVITYTHRITNTGSIDFNNIQFTALSEHGWSYKLAPSNPIAVAAGDSKPVTLTLTLPKGPDLRVLAGLVEHTRLTASAATPSLGVTTSASVTDTTTVLPQFVLDVSPGNSSGFGVPKGTSNFFHTLTNNGNIAGTVQITATTELGWATSVSTTTVQLAPGAASARSVTIGVAIPEATAAGTVVTTTVRFNVVGDPSQDKVVSDTTTVLLEPKVLLTHTGEADGQAQAGQKISFLYLVENRSNGPATFYLAGVPSFGGTKVRFQRLDGNQLGTNNSFLIGNESGSNQLAIVAEVTVDSQLLRGDVETVTIFLLDSQGRTYAAEQDKIFVTKSAFVPRAYLPIASK